MKPNFTPTSGQALVEFTGSLALLIPLSLGSGFLLKAQWDHLRCLHQAFEWTHDQMMDSRSHLLQRGFLYEEKDGVIRGTLMCPRGSEKVEFPRLEEAKW